MPETIQPEDKWFTEGDLKLHYLDWGNPGAPPMVLMHHHCGNAHYWDFFARNMQPDYHVIALDNRGHGGSCWAGNYLPRQYVADLSLFLDKTGIRDMVLIGHSLGGINAIIYAGAHPERVARLVIVDSGPELNAAGLEAMHRRYGSLPESFASEDEFVRLMQPVEPYYAESFARHLAEKTTRKDAAGRLSMVYDPALIGADLGNLAELWDDLPRITCPTLLLRGAESDVILPDVVRRMAEMLPGGRLVEIERAAHNLPGSNPEAFEAAVRLFLAEPA